MENASVVVTWIIPLANVLMSSAMLHSRRRPLLVLAASGVLFLFGPSLLPMTLMVRSISLICTIPKTQILMRIRIFHRADHMCSLWSQPLLQSEQRCCLRREGSHPLGIVCRSATEVVCSSTCWHRRRFFGANDTGVECQSHCPF